MMSSVMPSAKYSCSGSPLMLVNGSTASEGLSGRLQRRRALADRGSRRHQLEGAHRIGDVLHLLLALVVEARADLAPHRAVHRVGHGDAARFGQPLQPRGDVHAVAVHRAVRLLDHVAQVNADAKAHLAILRHGVGGDAAVPAGRRAPRPPLRPPSRTRRAPSRRPCRSLGRRAPRSGAKHRAPHRARPPSRARRAPSGASSPPRRPPESPPAAA